MRVEVRILERERYVESVQKVMIGNKEYTVTQTRPVLTPEELLEEQIKAKKVIVSVFEKQARGY